MCGWAWVSHSTGYPFNLARLRCVASAHGCLQVPSASLLALEQKLCQDVQRLSQWEALAGQHLAAWRAEWASRMEARLSHSPAVSELTAGLALTCCGGKTRNSELPLHMVQHQSLRLILYSVIPPPPGPELHYANQILPPLCFIAFIKGLLLSF